MLVLTRKVGEEVIIGDPHQPLGTVKVSSIKGGKVRLVFDFPGIAVYRREVAEQIKGGIPQSPGTDDDDEYGDGGFTLLPKAGKK